VSNGFTVAMGLAALLSFAGAIAGLCLPGRAVAVTAGARA